MKASIFIGTSLDGFIARSNGDLDFLPPGGGEPHGYDEFMATVDALVIGRKTFETVLAFDAWPYAQKPVFVLSSRPLAAAPPGAVVEHLSGAPGEIVLQLAARGLQHIYVDGGVTIQRFLQAGLIQRLIITRVPVLIGSGIPLFGALQHDVLLTHVATRQYASGLVQSEYVVAAVILDSGVDSRPSRTRRRRVTACAGLDRMSGRSRHRGSLVSASPTIGCWRRSAPVAWVRCTVPTTSS